MAPSPTIENSPDLPSSSAARSTNSRVSDFTSLFKRKQSDSPTGCWALSLKELSKLVNESQSLANATVPRMYCHRRGIFLHRFMVLMLERPGKKSIWLRVDRRTTGWRDLLGGFGVTPANDTVCTPTLFPTQSHTVITLSYLDSPCSDGKGCSRILSIPR